MGRTQTSTTFNLPPLPTISPEYLDSDQAADILRVGRVQIGRYVRDGGLKASKIGKRWLIARADLDSFVAQKMHVA
jgi:excisionase family DNA binding protein